MATTSSSTSTNGPKISLLKAKTGFIIPKNKLSGSLVSAYKGVKKPDGSDVSHEDSTKQMQRKTKWAPDLTQDATVKRGRALAYQTRVDQITQLLESGSLASQKGSTSAVDVLDHEQELELEKLEAISEMLKLNPSYKAPSDYKPLTREARVPLPMKEDAGYNFVSQVFGPSSDTLKRVEKETGALIRFYGSKLEGGEKIQVEVSASDGTELLSSSNDLHILVSADSYEKVDAAVLLIELLVASVSGKSVADAPSVAGDDIHSVSKSEGAESDPLTTAAMHIQGSVQSVMGSVTTPHGNIQSNPIPWLHMGPSPTSGFIQPPNVSPMPFYPSNMPSFSPRSGHLPGFGSAPPNSNLMPPRMQPPFQVSPNTFMPLTHTSGQSNTPNNSSASPFLGPPMPLLQPGPSSGSSSLPLRPLHGPIPMSSQTQSAASMLVQHFGHVPTSPNSNTSMGSPNLRGGLPPAVRPMQPGMPGLGPGGIPAPSFTPLRSPMGGPQNNAGDFTFQPHRPDLYPHPASRPNSHSGMQLPPPAPPSFRSSMQGSPLRPPVGNQMGVQLHPSHSLNPNQIPPSNLNPHMGAQNPNLFPPNAGAPFLPRHGNPASFQQGLPPRPGNPFPGNQGFHNNIHPGSGRPPFGPSGGHQVYDPFAPTSVPQRQGGNTGNVHRQENDPEYEDLMASVGVK